jgi:hypothetical protein
MSKQMINGSEVEVKVFAPDGGFGIIGRDLGLVTSIEISVIISQASVTHLSAHARPYPGTDRDPHLALGGDHPVP